MVTIKASEKLLLRGLVRHLETLGARKDFSNRQLHESARVIAQQMELIESTDFWQQLTASLLRRTVEIPITAVREFYLDPQRLDNESTA